MTDGLRGALSSRALVAKEANASRALSASLRLARVRAIRRTAWASGVALVGCVLVIGGCFGGRDRYPSQDGQREVVIERGRTAIENLWTVSLGDTAVFARHGAVGCFTDDDPTSGTPTTVIWSSSDSFTIETTAGEGGVRIDLNPDGTVRRVTQTGDDFLAPCPWT